MWLGSMRELGGIPAISHVRVVFFSWPQLALRPGTGASRGTTVHSL